MNLIMTEVEGTIKEIVVYFKHLKEKNFGDFFIEICKGLQIYTTHIKLDVGNKKIKNVYVPGFIPLQAGDYIKILYDKNGKIEKIEKKYYNKTDITFVIK